MNELDLKVYAQKIKQAHEQGDMSLITEIINKSVEDANVFFQQENVNEAEKISHVLTQIKSGLQDIREQELVIA
jgi:hypothetical protein